MDIVIMQKILQAKKMLKKPFEIGVVGFSMNPALLEKDIVLIQPQEEYTVGDILVFNYKQSELLIHRLLDIKDEKFYCKGDNAFRLEDITSNQIIGKAIEVKRNNTTILLPPCSKKLILLSMSVNRAFVKCRYNIEKTKETDIYKLYKKTILQKEESIMIYKKNENMDYIVPDDTSLVVFDPESGDTHFFDEIGIDILTILEQPCDLETLLTKLCEIYDASVDDIKADVEEFLDTVVSKKVVEVI